jgi:NAD(P)H-dependent FMN reductase
MSKLKLIIGSTRQNRVGKALADQLVTIARDAGVQLDVLDLRDVNLPKFDAPAPPQYTPTTVEQGKAWQSMVADGDAFIVLTPEYNASIPGSLKDAIDYLYDEWTGKKIAIVSYAWQHESTAARHLGDIYRRLKAIVVEPSVHMTFGPDSFAEDGSFVGAEHMVAVAKDACVAMLKSLQ